MCSTQVFNKYLYGKEKAVLCANLSSLVYKDFDDKLSARLKKLHQIFYTLIKMELKPFYYTVKQNVL